MRVGYFCESPADQAAVAVFAEGILGKPPDPINMDLEARSVPGFFGALEGVVRGVHYNSDAEGLIVVVDCDDDELHVPAHDAPGGGGDRCRLCRVRKIIAQARRQLKPRQGRPELKVAIGVPVPAIDAWYLVGKSHQIGEAAWVTGLASGRPPFTRPQLKTLVYGTDRPSLELATERAVTEARRIITDVKAIESAFPTGFGLMAQEVRSWTAK
ncbi:MAG TPA: hypothetical protein VG013_18535 [Gemmataceae bacterium]|jgi:hypothetical protein|nr:hypothetical protein [Gemmataceae bacterium]HEV3258874.1 hypothetical protein [Gemmataceae bacterium]